MIRRSKLKIRPAVARPAASAARNPATKPAKPSGLGGPELKTDEKPATASCPSKDSNAGIDALVPPSQSDESLALQIQPAPEQASTQILTTATPEDEIPGESGDKDSADSCKRSNAIHVQSTTSPCNISPRSGIDSQHVEKVTPSLDVKAAVTKIASGEDNQGTKNSAKPAAPKGRRRKLVACPQMARKRAKTTGDDDRPAKQVPAPDPTPTQNEVPLSESADTAPILSSYDILIPVPAVPEPVDDGGQQAGSGGVEGNSQKDLTPLTTVQTSSSPEPSMESQKTIATTQSPAKKAIGTERTETLPGESDPPSKEIDVYVAIKPVTEAMMATKPPSKPRVKTTTEIHRTKAVIKMKKALEKQEGNIKAWPEMDHNFFSMSDLIYLNPPKGEALSLGMHSQKENADEVVVAAPGVNSQQPATSGDAVASTSVAEEKEEDTSMPVPQIRIAADGTVVLDEESLVLDTEKPADPKIKTVYEFGREGTINQCSFMRRAIPRPARWSEEETNKFYKCLCIVGAEFSLMGAMFRERSADDLRRKYKRERKKNPSRVDKALMQQHLSKWTDDMFEPKTGESTKSKENGGEVT